MLRNLIEIFPDPNITSVQTFHVVTFCCLYRIARQFSNQIRTDCVDIPRLFQGDYFFNSHKMYAHHVLYTVFAEEINRACLRTETGSCRREYRHFFLVVLFFFLGIIPFYGLRPVTTATGS